MAQYESLAISAIIKKVNKNMFLPDIQRPYVWKELDVYKLFDSLMMGYPIGTMLIWILSREEVEKIEEQEKFKIEMFKFINNNAKKINEKLTTRERDDYWLVLDGQQRLTTLDIVLRGIWKDKEECEKELYLDALSGDYEIDDNLSYEFKFQDKKKGVFSLDADLPKKIDKSEYENEIVEKVIDEKRIKILSSVYALDGNYYNKKKHMGHKEEGEIKKIFNEIGFCLKAWINVKHIFESDMGKAKQKEAFFARVLKNVNITKDMEAKIKDNVNDLHNAMQDDAINYCPLKENDYDKVLDIFVRANSGGVKLGYSDLLFSRIKLNWPEARAKFSLLLNELNGNNYDFDNDFILKSCLVMLADKSDDIKYSIKSFSQERIQRMIESWEDIKSSFEFTIDKLDEYLINSPKHIPSNNALIPIIYWKFKNRHNSLSDDTDLTQQSNIRTWLIKALLSGVFGGQSDFMLYKCKQTIDSNSETFPSAQIESAIESANKSMVLKKNIIDTYKYNSPESYLFLSVAYKNSINFRPRFKKNLPEQDHIFCKAELKAAGIKEDKINSIYNIRYVTQYDNRKKLDDPFKIWTEGLKDKRDDVFKVHMIPNRPVDPEGKKQEWDVVSFELFLEERKKVLLQTTEYADILE